MWWYPLSGASGAVAGPFDGSGEVGQPSQPAAHDLRHQIAGADDARIGQPIDGTASVTLRLDEAGRTHHRQVFGGVGLADADGRRQATDLTGLVCQEVERP